MSLNPHTPNIQRPVGDTPADSMIHPAFLTPSNPGLASPRIIGLGYTTFGWGKSDMELIPPV